MEIKPTYVTFKQAKWLFEKGFNSFTKQTASLVVCNRDGKNEHYSFYKDATKWNLDSSLYPSLKKKCIISFHEKIGTNDSEMSPLLVAYNLVKGGDNGGIMAYLAPEQWQVVEWLRINHDIWINVFQNLGFVSFSALIYKQGNVIGNINEEFNSPQEVYSVAFDHIINQLN